MTPGELAQADPAWAWAPYAPSPEQPWDHRLAAHLFRRAGFGASAKEIRDAVTAGPQAVLDRLTSNEPDSPELTSETQGLADSALASGDARRLSTWWLYRMLVTPQPLVEKMTLFWHGHFATSVDKVQDVGLMYGQNQSLRRHALGSFRQMVHEISRDPAMLLYLDSATNRKAHANENYARELLELFCLGEGNYSERDVQQLARCFTGWEVRRGAFRFNQFQHDTGAKTIFASSREFSGEEAIDLVLQQASCPKFIVRKLFRWLICDEPEPADALLEPLARTFQEHDYEVAPLVRRMIGSQIFFSPLSVARKVRSPVELLLGLMRCLDGSTNLNNLANESAVLGQSLFAPPNVKGWDGGRTWINSATLVERANAVHRVLHDPNTRFGKRRLGEYLKSLASANESKDVVEQWEQLLFAIPLTEDRKQTLSQRLSMSKADSDSAQLETLHLMCSLPEFQLA